MEWISQTKPYSASSIKTFLNCELQYYYDKIRKPRPKFPIYIEFVRGKFLHKKIENFYNKEGNPKNKPYAKQEKGERKAPVLGEPFANSCRAQFLRMISEEKYHKQGIDFGRFLRMEGYKFILANDVWKIARQIYESYYQRKPPLFKELEFNFAVQHKERLINIRGTIDEINSPLTIRDHKSDYWLPEEESVSLNHDIQFTIYAAALSFLCSKNEELAKKCGCSLDDIMALKEDEFAIIDKVKIEHHHMRSGTITETFRKKDDFNYVLEKIMLIEEKKDGLKRKEAPYYKIFSYEWDKKCERCLYRKIHNEEEKFFRKEDNQDIDNIFIAPIIEKCSKEQLVLRFPRKSKAV